MTLPRREFLKSSVLISAAAALDLPRLAASEPASQSGSAPRECYELRTYRLGTESAAALLHGYLESALLPALNHAGLGPIGVFTEPEAKDGPATWVLIPHASPATVPSLPDIEADAAARPGAAAYLRGATREAPAFVRIDSWLLSAFAGLPRLAVPKLTRERSPRVFELRTYESHNEAKARNKVAMFNAGEIELMQRLGMAPVFYGQGLVGRDLPHLTYMLCSPDRGTAAQNWKAFGQHPIWERLKNDPQYADNVTKITSRFLTPLGYSQL